MSYETMQEFIKEVPEAYAPVLFIKQRSQQIEAELETRRRARLEYLAEIRRNYEKSTR